LFQRASPNVTQVFQEIHLRSQFREKVRVCNSLPISDQRPRIDPNAFTNDLRTIVGVAQAHGIKLLLMTQQTTWNGPENANLKEWEWILCRSGVRYREDFMDEALNALNDQTRLVARQYSIPIFDLTKAMTKSRDFFFDDVHFNERGAQEAARQLATVTREMLSSASQSQGK
jgi:lysophospholipase L1-like esterase